MKKIYTVIILILICTTSSFSHPGNTDSLGCHTCRTNCPKWGYDYEEYHCHNPKPSISNTYTSNSLVTPSLYNYNPVYTTTSTTKSCSEYGLWASYDYLSDSCKCLSGYVVGKDIFGKTSCVSGSSECSKLYGYASNFDSSSKTCGCMYGYEFGKDMFGDKKCVAKKIQTNNSYSYSGASSIINSNVNCPANSYKLLNGCICNTGYEASGSSCILKAQPQTISTTNNTQSSFNDVKNCPANTYIFQNRCVCNVGYIATLNGCVSDTTTINSNQTVVYGTTNTNFSCPVNSSMVNNKCTCNSGYEYSGSGCKLSGSKIESVSVNNNSKKIILKGFESLRECSKNTCKITYKVQKDEVANILSGSNGWYIVQVETKQKTLKTGYLNKVELNN